MQTHYTYALGYVDGLDPGHTRQYDESWPIDERTAYNLGFTRGCLDFIKYNYPSDTVEAQ